jgi:organic hydroperoxide reductase OsmC/OhrA
MQEFEAIVDWQRAGQAFSDQRYSRAHEWAFDGGLRVPASSSPLSVPLPMSDASCVDPEEAFVAAASSCHMLFFLSIAATRGFIVDSYHDKAVGFLDTDAEGAVSMTKIVLRPAIAFSGARLPDAVELAVIHHAAHKRCYIANSVKTVITVEGVD